MQFSGRLVKSLSSVPIPNSQHTSTLQGFADNAGKGIAKVVVKKGKAHLFRNGNPMVYSGAVDRIIGKPPPKTGDVVLVADGTEKPFGWGMYNSISMFSVRLMQLEDEATRNPSCVFNMESLLEKRINEAIQLRRSLGLPSVDTNAYRLVNSEGDRLSGLIVDIFGDIAVVATSAAWVEKYRPEIEFYINKLTEIKHVYWRKSIDILKEEGLDASEFSEGTTGKVKVQENGIFYNLSLEGQKTGFYADQRENRRFISTVSRGLRVLDICCYSGGFALNAAYGGALSVLGIDSSLPAVDLAKENISLNNFDGDKISFLKEDATAFMKIAANCGHRWDLVILDPPKLAPRRKDLQNASRMYRSLNSLAMKVTKEGGLLMTCSCSGAMTQSGSFLKILQLQEKKLLFYVRLEQLATILLIHHIQKANTLVTSCLESYNGEQFIFKLFYQISSEDFSAGKLKLKDYF